MQLNMNVVSGARKVRIAKEIKNFAIKSPWGIRCKPREKNTYDVLDFTMQGPKGSPYENGVFKLTVTIPDRYPFEPPLVKFVTPVYHPNIDNGGRICLDLLKMRPKGAWLPTITLETLLVTLQTLLANPNPDDPLMMDIANEYKSNLDKYLENAKNYTLKYADRPRVDHGESNNLSSADESDSDEDQKGDQKDSTKDKDKSKSKDNKKSEKEKSESGESSDSEASETRETTGLVESTKPEGSIKSEESSTSEDTTNPDEVRSYVVRRDIVNESSDSDDDGRPFTGVLKRLANTKPTALKKYASLVETCTKLNSVYKVKKPKPDKNE